MSLVDFSIRYVMKGHNDISRYALRLAFDNPNDLGYGSSWGGNAQRTSIESGIYNEVIMGMIAPLLDIEGGTTEMIDLTAARIEHLEGGKIAVNVPDSVLGDRRITSVLEVYPGNMNSLMLNGMAQASGTCGSGGQFGGQISRLVNSVSDRMVTRTFSDITMTGMNSFIIHDCFGFGLSLTAKCIVGYDNHFSVIPEKAWKVFGDLVVLGVKAYIYKHCRRGLREAVQRLGAPLDDLKDEIDGYSDAHREFDILFEDEIKLTLQYADPKGVIDSVRWMMPKKL